MYHGSAERALNVIENTVHACCEAEANRKPEGGNFGIGKRLVTIHWRTYPELSVNKKTSEHKVFARFALTHSAPLLIKHL